MLGYLIRNKKKTFIVLVQSLLLRPQFDIHFANRISINFISIVNEWMVVSMHWGKNRGISYNLNTFRDVSKFREF